MRPFFSERLMCPETFVDTPGIGFIVKSDMSKPEVQHENPSLLLQGSRAELKAKYPRYDIDALYEHVVAFSFTEVRPFRVLASIVPEHMDLIERECIGPWTIADFDTLLDRPGGFGTSARRQTTISFAFQNLNDAAKFRLLAELD